MRFFTKHVVLIAVQLLVVTGIKAEGIFSSSEGTNYLWFNGTKSSTNYAYLVACQNSDRPYVGDVVIPESVTEWIWPDDIVGSVVGGVYTVTGIDAGAFVGCTEVKTITIPSTVTGNIEGSFFSGCTSLTAINVDPENTQYSSIDGVLYNKDQTELIRVPETRTSIVIPNTVRTIGASAFSGCTKLTSVEMPMVTTIEENAFSNCTGLTSIEFPTSLNSIGDRAFRGCTGLTSVVIPRYVRNLWSSSFEECTNLKTAVVYSSNTGFAFTNAEEVYYLYPDAIISDASTVESFTGTIYGTQQVLDQFTSPDIQKVKLYALKKEAMLGAVTLTFDSICSKLQLGEVLLNEDSDDLEIKVERKGNEYKIGGLLPGWTCTIRINALFNGEPVTLPIEIETQTPVIPIPTIIKRYQTKIVMNISAPVDESFPIVELRIFGETIKDYKGGTQRVVLRNLIPGKDDYSFSVSAYYGDYPWNYAYFYSKSA